MANPRLPDITEAEQNLLYEKLNAYNRNRTSYKEAGCYLIVLPREGHPDYSLWFYTPFLERRNILFIEDLKPDIVSSLRIATSVLWYVNRQVLVTQYNEKRMSHNGDDLVSFGKYRGHFLYEVLRIDPSYVNWIAFKFTARIPKQERFVKMAQAYNTIYLDKMSGKRRRTQPLSRYLGVKGEKLTNLTLKVLRVRLEDDPYKTELSGTTPLFYVRQRLTAVDANGNLVNLAFSSSTPSLVSGRLPSLEHAFQPGEVLHIASARISGTYENRGICYTRLNYIKFNKGSLNNRET
ncbi:hypothetical protein [Parabacteroides sp. AM08-6]|uniref:exodeoxyribonuclease X C-terminal domain-containing protein n=1 Tax=Parabacteroides sp. AM08-6 TaxID=2292053 RepID=UPI000F0097B3|nr:hypothetical protein [Parabacteroides sp. AM08-6]RHJ84837.1 hypothetical protein DW103_05155 [Parabacteroides sp. AM08-6]